MISINTENMKNAYLVFFSLCQDSMVSVEWSDTPEDAAIKTVEEVFGEEASCPISTRVVVLDIMKLKGETGRSWFSFNTASVAQDAGLFEEARKMQELTDGEENEQPE